MAAAAFSTRQSVQPFVHVKPYPWAASACNKALQVASNTLEFALKSVSHRLHKPALLQWLLSVTRQHCSSRGAAKTHAAAAAAAAVAAAAAAAAAS
jgi:hypothetical protein